MHSSLLYLKLIRIVNLLIALGVIMISFYLLEEPFSILTFVTASVIISTMSIGYIVNDIIDVSTDLINKKNNLIAKKIISYKESYFLILFFLIILLVSSAYINHTSQIILYFLVLPVLLLYNFFLKTQFIIGNICVALMLSFVFLFTAVVVGQNINMVYTASFFAFFLNFIREIIKDLNDFEGDFLNKMKTAPIILGRQKTLILLKILIISLVVFLFYHSYFYSTCYYFISAIILVEIPLIYSLFLLHYSANKNTIYKLTFLYKGINITGMVVIFLMKEIF